jgi:hypothetical protein
MAIVCVGSDFFLFVLEGRRGRGRRKEEGGRRKEEGGRRKEEGGRRKDNPFSVVIYMAIRLAKFLKI